MPKNGQCLNASLKGNIERSPTNAIDVSISLCTVIVILTHADCCQPAPAFRPDFNCDLGTSCRFDWDLDDLPVSRGATFRSCFKASSYSGSGRTLVRTVPLPFEYFSKTTFLSGCSFAFTPTFFSALPFSFEDLTLSCAWSYPFSIVPLSVAS